MSAADNAALARRIYEAFNEDDFDFVLDNATEDVELMMASLGQTLRGREGFEQMMRGWKGAFPDMKIEATNQVADDDGVAVEFIARGTHTGTLIGPAGEIPATGRSVELKVVEVWKVRDGKVASLHNYQDSTSLMQQLGLMPSPEPAGA